MKKILAKNIETLVEFNQHFVQGLWQGDDPLLQLPHFNENVIKNYRRLLREHSIPDAKIETFCRLSPHQRQSLKLLPAKEMSEVEALIRVLPLVEVSCKAFTENETEMNCSDAITWQFMVKYPNLKEKEFPGLVHS
jgi:hypothetical protein